MGSDFRRQRVFQLVRQSAEFLVAAGGGIAFQRVHGTPRLAQNLLVAGMFLQLQANVIEGLQQFGCALKEEFAHFSGPLVRKEIQDATSSRW